MSGVASLVRLGFPSPVPARDDVQVTRAQVLGTSAWVAYTPDRREARRRRALSLGAVVDWDLLDTLMELPEGMPVPLSALSSPARRRVARAARSCARHGWPSRSPPSACRHPAAGSGDGDGLGNRTGARVSVRVLLPPHGPEFRATRQRPGRGNRRAAWHRARGARRLRPGGIPAGTRARAGLAAYDGMVEVLRGHLGPGRAELAPVRAREQPAGRARQAARPIASGTPGVQGPQASATAPG